MSDNPERTNSEIRREVYEEILKWLRAQNKRRDRLSLFDSPFVVTVIGGLFITFVTFLWQSTEKRHQIELAYQRAISIEQVNLLEKFPNVYETAGGTLNSWFARVVWIARETNEPPTDATQKNIDEWKEVIRTLEDKYLTADSLDGRLTQIQVLYQCNSAKVPAAELHRVWQDFQNGFQSFNREWNNKQTLPKERIDEAESLRKELLTKMESLMQQLLKGMGAELSNSRHGDLACPP